MPNSNEQWLLDGICHECRRIDYCSKPCKKNKERTEREVMAYIHERTGMGGVLEQLGVGQNGLLASCKAWSEAIDKAGYVN